MHISDYEHAIELWRTLAGIGLSSADSEIKIRKFLEKNPGTCFAALKQNNLIGTILGGSDGRRGYIYHLAVQESEQEQGVGKKLLDACLTAFKALGIQKCHIFVISDNLKGIDFWLHTGWEKRDDILVMSKELND